MIKKSQVLQSKTYYEKRRKWGNCWFYQSLVKNATWTSLSNASWTDAIDFDELIQSVRDF